MIKKIFVEKSLADSVDEELHSTSPKWEYYNHTLSPAEFKNNTFFAEQISKNNSLYFEDTFRFTDVIYLETNQSFGSFWDIRTNKKSRYNETLKNTAKLVDFLQFNCDVIPKYYRISRFYIHMFTVQSKHMINYPHTDADPGNLSLIYYVNDTDGDTYFFNDGKLIEQISPKKGMAIVFPSDMIHCGSLPTKHNTRVVLNIVLTPT